MVSIILWVNDLSAGNFADCHARELIVFELYHGRELPPRY